MRAGGSVLAKFSPSVLRFALMRAEVRTSGFGRLEGLKLTDWRLLAEAAVEVVVMPCLPAELGGGFMRSREPTCITSVR